MLAIEYLNGGMPEVSPQLKSEWKAVREQAATHAMSRQQGRIVNVVRPDRPESVKEYVESVQRDITVSEFRKLHNKLSRILRASGLRIETKGVAISAWMGEKHIEVSGVKTGLYDWIFTEFIFETLTDPNGCLVAFPYYKAGIPPAAPVSEGGLPLSESVKVAPRIISSEDIRYYDGECLVYHYSNVEAGKVYMFVSDEGFQLMIPHKKEDAIRYMIEPWYVPAAGIGLFPVTTMPGYRTKGTANGKKYSFKASYASPAFAWWDEAITSFSDNQAVRYQHAYPKQIMRGRIPCTNTKCYDGYEISGSQGKEVKTMCGICKGKGSLRLDPMNSITIPKDSADKFIEYIYPPETSVKITYEVAMDTLLKGAQAMGLSLLGSETESGEAKKYRLEDLEDMLASISSGILKSVCEFLEAVQSLITNNREREEIDYVLPGSFSHRDRAELTEVWKSAPDHAKQGPFIALIEHLYEESPEMILAYKAAVLVEPMIAWTPETVNQMFAWGLLTREVIQRSQDVLKQAIILSTEKKGLEEIKTALMRSFNAQ